MIVEECFVGRREGVTESLSQAIPPLIFCMFVDWQASWFRFI